MAETSENNNNSTSNTNNQISPSILLPSNETEIKSTNRAYTDAVKAAEVDVPCTSIAGFDRIVKMGNNTFFQEGIGLWNYVFVNSFYREFYSHKNIPLNRRRTIEKYKFNGVFRNQFINRQRMKVNLDFIRNCNPGYNISDNSLLARKVWVEGICSDISIDAVPVQKCSEGIDTFEVFDFDILNDCSESAETIFGDDCQDDYNFFSDLFDWKYVLFCNRRIVKQGYNGCVGTIEWYLNEGIYEGAAINQWGSVVDLNYVACANGLYELRCFREIVCWLVQFGFCDPEVELTPPQPESCLTRKLTPYNFDQNYRISKYLNSFIARNCVSAESANITSHCGQPYYNTSSGGYNTSSTVSPASRSGRSRIRWDPDALIDWSFLNENTNNVSSTSYSKTNPNGSFNLSGSTNNNRGIFALQTNNPSPNYNTNSKGFDPYYSSNNLAAPSVASRRTYNSENERFKLDTEQSIIRSQNIRQGQRSNVQSQSAGNIESSVQVPGRCNCGATNESFATANSPAGSNIQPTCPNCLPQFSAFNPINQNIGFITPLTLTTNPVAPSLNGTNTNSVLLGTDSSGNISSTSGISGLINANSGNTLNACCGGGGYNRQTYQTTYNRSNMPSFSNPFNSVYFS
jgi:hypothetical protein